MNIRHWAMMLLTLSVTACAGTENPAYMQMVQPQAASVSAAGNVQFLSTGKLLN